MPHTTTRNNWLQHIAAWRDSGVSQKAYCRQNNLPYSSLGYWRRRLKSTASTGTKLIPVSLSQPTLLNIFLPSGLRIETPVQGLADVLSIIDAGKTA